MPRKRRRVMRARMFHHLLGARHWPCARPRGMERQCSPLALGGGLGASCRLAAPGASPGVGSLVPPRGARGQPWRSKQRGRAQGRHLILGGTIFAQRFGKERFPEYNKTTFPCLGAWRQRSALPLHQGKQWTSCLYSTCKFGSIEQC